MARAVRSLPAALKLLFSRRSSRVSAACCHFYKLSTAFEAVARGLRSPLRGLALGRLTELALAGCRCPFSTTAPCCLSLSLRTESLNNLEPGRLVKSGPRGGLQLWLKRFHVVDCLKCNVHTEARRSQLLLVYNLSNLDKTCFVCQTRSNTTNIHKNSKLFHTLKIKISHVGHMDFAFLTFIRPKSNSYISDKKINQYDSGHLWAVAA